MPTAAAVKERAFIETETERFTDMWTAAALAHRLSCSSIANDVNVDEDEICKAGCRLIIAAHTYC